MMAKGHHRRRRKASLIDPSTVATLLGQERNKRHSCSFPSAATTSRHPISSRPSRCLSGLGRDNRLVEAA